jgi:hypothetical protein
MFKYLDYDQVPELPSSTWIITKYLSYHQEVPRHFETTDEAEMLKNVVLHSVATAFASIVLPVPELV